MADKAYICGYKNAGMQPVDGTGKKAISVASEFDFVETISLTTSSVANTTAIPDDIRLLRIVTDTDCFFLDGGSSVTATVTTGEPAFAKVDNWREKASGVTHIAFIKPS